MRAAIAIVVGFLTVPLPALGQQVIVRTSPPRATLVCDGRVVGITPVAVNLTRVHSCTRFARDHVNLTFDPTTLTGVIASYRLEPVSEASDPPCNTLDPQTGLLRPCLEEDPPPRWAFQRNRCGHVDRLTGLLEACLSDTTPPNPSPPPRRQRCGQVDPSTGLMHVCLTESLPPPRRTRRRSTAPQCRAGVVFDPVRALFLPCF